MQAKYRVEKDYNKEGSGISAMHFKSHITNHNLL